MTAFGNRAPEIMRLVLRYLDWRPDASRFEKRLRERYVSEGTVVFWLDLAMAAEELAVMAQEEFRDWLLEQGLDAPTAQRVAADFLLNVPLTDADLKSAYDRWRGRRVR